MSGSEDSGEVGEEVPAEEADVVAGDELAGEPEVEPAAGVPETRLRRGLFGYRTGDVRAEIEARNAEADELRDDVSALWLVFNQHERAIRELIVAVERLGGGRIPPPGERNWDDPDDEGRKVPDAWMADQMEGLDEVLAAIKQATDLLERGYEAVDSAAPPPAGAPPPPPPQQRPVRTQQATRPPRTQQPAPPPNGAGSGSGNAAERH